MIGAEDEFPTAVASLIDTINDSGELGGRRWGILNLGIASVLLVELNVRIHESRSDTSLSAAHKSRQCVRSQEGRCASNPVANMTAEGKLGMQLFSEVTFEIIVPVNINNSLGELWKLYADLVLGASQHPVTDQLVESGTSSCVEFINSSLRQTKK